MEKVRKTWMVEKQLAEKVRDAAYHGRVPQSEVVGKALAKYLDERQGDE